MNAPDKQSERSSVITRLIDLIEKIPQGEQHALLNELEERFSRLKREHNRKPISSNIEYVTKYGSDKGLIKNISAGGVFIETRMPFRSGEDITLNFIFPLDPLEQVNIKGRIVRINPNGVGIEFHPLTHEQEICIKSYLEND
jgi:Tfp pilus assembly protein PilZ